MSESRRTIQWTAAEEDVNERLDRVLGKHPDIQTRSQAEKIIKDEKVLVNGKKSKASYKVQTGDKFEISIPEVKIRTLDPENIPIEILYEDADLAVINKPAGLVMHPSAGHWNGTLVNALLYHIKDLSMGFHEDRPGIVHRLDKETSGVVVVAKNNKTHEALAKNFRDRTVHRIYWAIVHGALRQPVGRVESLLARHPTQRKRYASGKEGKWSATNYHAKESTKNLSLVHCRLETGRTHQIRVHLSEMGHPLVGDSVYGADRQLQKLSGPLKSIISNMTRIGLHAAELGFEHPTLNKLMMFKAPWPEDLKDLLLELGWQDE